VENSDLNIDIMELAVWKQHLFSQKLVDQGRMVLLKAVH